MTARNLVAVRVYGQMIRVDPAYPDDTEAGIAALLSSLGVASESAAPFAESAAILIGGFEFETCAECGADLDAHEIGPDMFGKAHAVCLHCPLCGHRSRDATAAVSHFENRTDHPDR
jgi:hypothetical protein